MWTISDICFTASAAALLSCLTIIPGSMGNTDFAEAGLEVHNYYRSLHNSAAMELDSELNGIASRCAEYYAGKGKADHSCEERKANGLGENLYRKSKIGSNEVDNVKAGVKKWYDEISDYDFSKSSGKGTGHFTQLVWKGSTKLGIGHARNGKKSFVVALYSPRGNIKGRYEENVSPKH